jgi:DNA-binding NarL/FixJ family response regulator
LWVGNDKALKRRICKLLQKSEAICVVGAADSGATAVKQAARLRPDVVLMDYQLPAGAGLETCRRIRAVCPHTRVLFITSTEDQNKVFSANQAGASGLVLKQIPSIELIRSIKAVAAGQSVIDTAMTDEFVKLISVKSDLLKREVVLPTQQSRVLALIAQGYTNREIAGVLALSEKTVSNYIRIIFQKLGFTRRVQAAAYYFQNHPQNPAP